MNKLLVKSFIILIFTTGAMMKQTACSQEDRPQNTKHYKEPSSDFKQLRNSDYRRFYIETPEDTAMKDNQRFYDEFLKMLLWSHYRYSANWDNLDMSGLKQLQWVVETNKDSYKIGEPIGFRLSLKNISEKEVTVLYPSLYPGFMLNSIMLKRFWGKEEREVFLTNDAYRLYWAVGFNGNPRAFKSFLLKPGEKAPTNQDMKFLNPYYDLSASGEYELTFYTRNYLGDDEHQIGEYPKPCTIRFKIENTFYEPELNWDEPKPK